MSVFRNYSAGSSSSIKFQKAHSSVTSKKSSEATVLSKHHSTNRKPEAQGHHGLAYSSLDTLVLRPETGCVA